MPHIQVKYPTHVAFHKVLFWVLYLIYINDLLLENTSSKTSLFADDSTITVRDKEIKFVKEHLSNEAISTNK